MTEPLESSEPDPSPLGEIVARLLAQKNGFDREEAKACYPEHAEALDSVFEGLDIWKALSQSSMPIDGPASLAGCLPRHRNKHHEPEPGTLIVPATDSRLASGFQLVKILGEGSSGTVYQARLPSEVHGRPDIALKLLKSGDRLDISQRMRDAADPARGWTIRIWCASTRRAEVPRTGRSWPLISSRAATWGSG